MLETSNKRKKAPSKQKEVLEKQVLTEEDVVDSSDCDDIECTCTCTCPSCHHDSHAFTEELSDEDIEDLSLFFKALADPSRLKIVVALLRHGQLSVSEIAKECDSTVSATSHQLAQLRMHKLVSVKRQGLRNIYKLCDFHISEGIKLAIEHIKE